MRYFVFDEVSESLIEFSQVGKETFRVFEVRMLKGLPSRTPIDWIELEQIFHNVSDLESETVQTIKFLVNTRATTSTNETSQNENFYFGKCSHTPKAAF